MAHSEKDLLERVKRRFLRMTSPHEFSGDEKRKTGTIVSLNISPLLARADAAANTLFAILQKDLIVAVPDDAKRNAVYRYAKTLASDAKANAQEAMQNAVADKRKLDLSALIEYMDFLHRHLEILSLLTQAQSQADTRTKSTFLTGVIQRQDLLCSAGELSIFPFLQDTVSSLNNTFEKIQEQARKVLTKTESERYGKACAAFTAAYTGKMEQFTCSR